MFDKRNLVFTAFSLLRPFWLISLLSTLIGALGGLTTAWLLATINQALYADAIESSLAWIFAGLVVLKLVGESTANLSNGFVGQQIIARLRKDLSDKILTAPIDRLERFQVHRLSAALNHDLGLISAFTFQVSTLAISASIVFGCIVYLLLLSPTLFLIAAAGIGAGAAANLYARHLTAKRVERIRMAHEDLHKHFRCLTQGAKELRLNRLRRSALRENQLGSAVNRIRDETLSSTRIFMAANTFATLMFFAAIGLLIALRFGLKLDKSVLSGFILVLLFVKGPIDQILSLLPLIGQAQVAFRKLVELATEFSNSEQYLLLEPQKPISPIITSIELSGVLYAFPAEKGPSPFSLGPVDLTIKGGEILFIVGENGSGKTTLIKLILGLYTPQEGAVLLNGEAVTTETCDDYRQIFSTVFFDYYLFEDLATPDGFGLEKVTTYLEKLDIAHKVRIEGGAFSTTDLSAGQRKRLALIHCYLENRPVLVFDEWAAEQDPTFRTIFYRELLPDLKRQGKTLIVISHDDRYFDAADRLIRLKEGQIVEAWTEESAAQALRG
ncbi:cyclic peptide export ABC transporter [Beijerinckia indica]|uniref:Cyclic peptide transporter n=1 Tax=Beijerinckia indica subsp. indica (strain ATCC 9039 / DSM 1715 / NCIMB 8712) TaxID=395963 RepID=B2IB80_BEII9|nr:cyclic peptide export ABC transporter [Beijerinckia indica]ACB95164.1 cyclic peptide transporter [Beijerinckia indica subsp. indica ATCC 9039]